MTKYIYINVAKEKCYVTEEALGILQRGRRQINVSSIITLRTSKGAPVEVRWDCNICEFHRSGDRCSLDYKNDEGIMDKVSEDTVMKDMIAYSMRLDSTISKLCELDSGVVKMFETWKENPKASV